LRLIFALRQRLRIITSQLRRVRSRVNDAHAEGRASRPGSSGLACGKRVNFDTEK
jgi:hypothetical protein